MEAVIDTRIITARGRGLTSYRSRKASLNLEETLERIGIPFRQENLYSAGNGTHLILRTLLFLVARIHETSEQHGRSETRISRSKQIVLSPIKFFKCQPVPCIGIWRKANYNHAERAAQVAFTREEAAQVNSDWLDGSEDSLGATIFGLDEGEVS